MKSFQHDVSAHDDPHVRELMFRWGPQAYAAWFITMELVANEVKVLPGGKVITHLSARSKVFTEACMMSSEVLQDIYRYSSREGKFQFRAYRGKWVIKWPKILEISDKYTKDLLSWAQKQAPIVETLSDKTLIGAPIGNRKGREGGVGGEKGQSAYSLGKHFNFLNAPHPKTIERYIKDLRRQGIAEEAIIQAAESGRARNAGFFEIVRELEKGKNNGSGSTERAGVGRFAIPGDEFDSRMRERIANREREEEGRSHPALK